MTALSDIASTLRRARSVLVAIQIYHGVLFLGSVILLVRLWSVQALPEVIRMPALTALFALIGNAVYFSRKCYVYLISDKFGNLLDRGSGEQNDVNRLRRKITGYYLYLIFRPITGMVIGPILYLLVISGGLITFVATKDGESIGLSAGGRYVMCAVSFLAGHASSDVFDYFSWLAAKRIRKHKASQ
jgi:hypothetical protein